MIKSFFVFFLSCSITHGSQNSVLKTNILNAIQVKKHRSKLQETNVKPQTLSQWAYIFQMKEDRFIMGFMPLAL